MALMASAPSGSAHPIDWKCGDVAVTSWHEDYAEQLDPTDPNSVTSGIARVWVPLCEQYVGYRSCEDEVYGYHVLSWCDYLPVGD